MSRPTPIVSRDRRLDYRGSTETGRRKKFTPKPQEEQVETAPELARPIPAANADRFGFRAMMNSRSSALMALGSIAEVAEGGTTRAQKPGCLSKCAVEA
jgi:hypothetical protein